MKKFIKINKIYINIFIISNLYEYYRNLNDILIIITFIVIRKTF
jgi:hypothetical protein